MNELLNCNVGCIFLTMGLPTLDPVMTSVLDYIHQHALFLGSWGGFAKSLGLILAFVAQLKGGGDRHLIACTANVHRRFCY